MTNLKTKQLEELNFKKDRLVTLVCDFCQYSVNYSIIKQRGYDLVLWVGHNEYTIRVCTVDEQPESSDLPEGVHCLVFCIEDFVAFAKSKFNLFMKWVEKNGTDRQKRIYGFL